MIRFIHDIHESCRAAGRPSVSLEFFPTKTPEGETNLLEKTIPALMALKPDYCSVTYGAGGSTRDKTIGIVDRIQREHGLTTMMHLTCVNSTKAELASVLAEAKARGVKNILALRGDPPAGASEWTATEGGFMYSSQLVAFLKEMDGFCIGTAGFPEGHIAQKGGKVVDWGFLCDKIAAGADFVITQLFFDNEDFFRFQEFLTKRGVKVPIMPGILPVSSAKQTKKFTEMCGAKLPAPFLKRLDEIGDDDVAATQFGIEYATEQCRGLLKAGVTGLHFYTLNKAAATTAIVRNLGLAV
ncbi:MAG: methylenetetrahydrofolate reductase [NAD(P)H] [Verrucomicrobiota bacterium]